MNSRSKQTSGLVMFKQLMPVIGLLWVFLFLRIYHIEGILPYFIDELRHIERGRIVWSFSELEISAHPGKFLLYYWLGLFELPLHQPGWIARTSVALFSVIGAAGTYALAKRLFSVATAYLSLIILISLPFMLFYERLALSDPLAASLAIVMMWWSTIVVKYPTRRNGIILGVWISLMIMAKILAAPLVIMPVLAVLLFNPHHTLDLRKKWWSQIRQLWTVYRPAIVATVIVVGVVWGFILAVYVSRGILVPEKTTPLVDRYLYEGVRRTTGESQDAPAWKLWEKNWWRFQEIIWFLWGPILLGLAIIATPLLLKFHWRKYVYLVIAPLIIWGLVVFAAGQLTTRYLTAAGHMMVILLAAGTFTIRDILATRFNNRWLNMVPVLLIVIWIGTDSVLFYDKLVTDPTELEMPQRDTWEYFSNQTGYGLQPALLDIAKMPSVSRGETKPLVYGMVRNCQYLESHIPDDMAINIKCGTVHNVWPRRDFPNRAESYADIEMMTRQYDEIYLLMEDLGEPPIIDKWKLDAHLDYVKTYARPYDGIPVNLYIASPRNPLNVEYIEP